MKGYYGDRWDLFSSLEKRNFRFALLRLLENEYKLIGSRRVLNALADDIERLQEEYFPHRDRLEAGMIAWVTTRKTERKPSYGKHTEDYQTVMIYLPLVTSEDIDKRVFVKAGTRNSNYRVNRERDIETMVRLVKSAWAQGGMLSQAELCVLMNRSLTTMRKYIAEYEASHPNDALPLKGYILDQGSRPTHKGIILNLYEQGVDPTDIARRTNHGLDAVDRYIKAYERVKGLYKKGMANSEIQKVTGLSRKVVNAYLSIAKHFHPSKKESNIPFTE
ncbi:MAG: DUF1670 domain-containing protein [Aliifodinibius sp.]|nr:DUF1670 domain-containing protein [Fodinibius sp.]NIX01247.1 DUF1670 domain-containing protein [Phycisphaerae bacterium]NIY26526.1 DUF1670 domain-containing protein [Fodinibius sp.]